MYIDISHAVYSHYKSRYAKCIAVLLYVTSSIRKKISRVEFMDTFDTGVNNVRY